MVYQLLELTRERTHSESSGVAFMGSMLNGLGSRSSETAKIARRVRDKNADPSLLRKAMDSDIKEIAAAQTGSFAYRSGGQVDWHDILRPIASDFKGFQLGKSEGHAAIGPVERHPRTNTFYRAPSVNADIDCSGEELSRHVPYLGPDTSVIVLPAPYTFTKMVEDVNYNNPERLAEAYAGAIAKSEPALVKKGYTCMILTDPFVGYEQSMGKFENPIWYQEALSVAKVPEMMLGVSFPLAEARDVAPLAENSAVDFVGIDVVSSSNLRINTSKDVLLGVVDISRVRIETQEKIRTLASEFLSEAEFSGRYYTGPNDRLYDVPFEVQLAKIAALAEFTGVN